MKKTLLSLFAIAAIAMAFVSCDNGSSTTTDDTETTTTTYTGSELQTFLGLGTLNSDGDLEITPNGYNTFGTLGTSFDSSIQSITINAKVSESGYQGVLQFMDSDWSSKMTTSATITATELTDYTQTDFSSFSDVTWALVQPMTQDTTDYAAQTTIVITVHSITIVQ